MSVRDDTDVDLHLAILDRLDAPPPAPVPAVPARPARIGRAVAPTVAVAFAAILVLVVLVGTAGRPEREAPPAADPAVELSPYPALSATVLDGSAPEEARLELVDQLRVDGSDGATDTLLAGAGGPSVMVSMASMRALRGRPCERVAAPLTGWLAHREWQRRAWAAKVLGENRCGAASAALRARLVRERDARVRRQLSAALAELPTG